MKIDRSDERLVGATDPGWPALRQQQKNFGNEQAVLVYLRAKDLWTTERLTALQNVAFALEDTPGITSVKTLLSATNIRDKGHYVDAGPLIYAVPKTVKELAEKRDDALYSPIIRGNYISADGNATAIMIGYAPKPGDSDHELAVYRTIEARIEIGRAHV